MSTGVTVAAVAQVPMVFLAVVPGVETMLAANSETEAQRISYARDTATLVALGIGALISVAARDAEPFLFTLATTAIMYYVTERMTLAMIGTNNVQS